MQLGCEFIPQLDGELAVGCSEGANESIFEVWMARFAALNLWCVVQLIGVPLTVG